MSVKAVPLSVVCPVRNGAAALPAAIAFWRAQTVPADEFIVVDDGSTDATARVATEAGARVVRFEQNRGRGAARAAGVRAASGEFLLMADAHNVIAPDFAERALAALDEPRLVGVVGCWHDPDPRGVLGRWRARHLFRCGRGGAGGGRKKTLSTHACVLRREAVLAAGNFDESRTADEDTELGLRMVERGGQFLWTEACRVSPQRDNTWSELVERHTRWYVRTEERFSWAWYRRWVAYAAKEMVRADLRARDWAAVGLSLWLPHAMAWRVWQRGAVQ